MAIFAVMENLAISAISAIQTRIRVGRQMISCALPRTKNFAGALLIALANLILPATAGAQGFSAVISPPRFELAVQPGKISRHVIEITHVANQRGSYRVYTNDWSLGPDGNAFFSWGDVDDQIKFMPCARVDQTTGQLVFKRVI